MVTASFGSGVLLAPAIRIEPGLRRDIRRLLGTAADTGTEADRTLGCRRGSGDSRRLLGQPRAGRARGVPRRARSWRPRRRPWVPLFPSSGVSPAGKSRQGSMCGLGRFQERQTEFPRPSMPARPTIGRRSPIVVSVCAGHPGPGARSAGRLSPFGWGGWRDRRPSLPSASPATGKGAPVQLPP